MLKARATVETRKIWLRLAVFISVSSRDCQDMDTALEGDLTQPTGQVTDWQEFPHRIHEPLFWKFTEHLKADETGCLHAVVRGPFTFLQHPARYPVRENVDT